VIRCVDVGGNSTLQTTGPDMVATTKIGYGHRYYITVPKVLFDDKLATTTRCCRQNGNRVGTLMMSRFQAGSFFDGCFSVVMMIIVWEYWLFDVVDGFTSSTT
jgi:hypothetical protein